MSTAPGGSANGESTSLHDRLRTGLAVAMKSRDVAAVAALRSTLGAVDNAGAVPAPVVNEHLAIELTVPGAGAAEMARRVVTEAEVEAIVRAEVAERQAAAGDHDRAGQPERAARLRQGAEALTRHLPPATTSD